jgi:hypothetical protein
MLIENEPERLADLPSGEIPPAEQPLAEDPALSSVFTNEAVLRRAGGLSGLEDWLLRENPVSGRMSPGTLETSPRCAMHPA